MTSSTLPLIFGICEHTQKQQLVLVKNNVEFEQHVDQSRETPTAFYHNVIPPIFRYTCSPTKVVTFQMHFSRIQTSQDTPARYLQLKPF